MLWLILIIYLLTNHLVERLECQSIPTKYIDGKNSLFSNIFIIHIFSQIVKIDEKNSSILFFRYFQCSEQAQFATLLFISEYKSIVPDAFFRLCIKMAVTGYSSHDFNTYHIWMIYS